MTQYGAVLHALGLPAPVVRCVTGMIQSPLAIFRAPAEWYVFPPALIPMWSNGSGPSYIGYWKHWFLNREPSFVEIYVELKCLTMEIARTPEQLFCLLAIRAICMGDGINDDVRAFASEVGIENLTELDNVTNQTGDDPIGFWRIRQFQANLPLASTTDIGAYTGDFPTGDFTGSHVWWHECCSCELPESCLSRWPLDINIPDWLKDETDKRWLFNRYLRSGDLARAWLTLNSTGWLIRDARLAIALLRDAARDNAFDLLVSAWLSLADESAGGY